MSLPPDHAARLAARDLDSTILLEAGAGTGKTRVLVDRFVACLLSGAPVDTVVAITFTEKAAGELRQRVRERLERLLGDVPSTVDAGEPLEELLDEPSRTADARRLLEAALVGLDTAPISTIHSFAGRLLRERPVEAGLDPAFVQLDQTGADLQFDEQWRRWLDGLAEGGGDALAEAAALFRELLTAGMRVDGLRDLARRRFAERYSVADVSDPIVPDLEPDLAQAKAEAAALRVLVGGCSKPDDGLCGRCNALVAAMDELDPTGGVHTAGAAARSIVDGPFWAKVGRKEAWPDKDATLAQRRRVFERCEAAAAAYEAYVGAVALRLVDRFAAAAARERVDAGLLDFDDLLGKARNLLRGDPGRRAETLAVRRAVGERFRYLLVDEFQDTDPLQAEIVFFLAEQEPRADVWSDVVLLPGKLFLVGDPKQSIYRFRRADISMYHEATAAIEAQGGTVLRLTHNFRTVAPIVDWVNDVFDEVIGGDRAPGLQPGYQRLSAERPQQPGRPAVLRLPVPGDRGEKVGVDELCAREAATIAALVSEVVASGVPAGDVALLLPVFTHVAQYEQALRDATIPYRIEGGRTYYTRREVRDLVTVLRAVATPCDQVGVFAALRALPFGFPDDDLYEFRTVGGAFDYLRPQDDVWATLEAGIAAGLQEALQCLADLHRACHLRPAWETLDELVRRTAYAEALAAWAGDPEQAVGNLEQLSAVAAAFDGEPGVGFFGFVRHVREQSQAADTAESPVGEAGDAVRLLTVHKAKGLEFRVVVAADLAASRTGATRGEVLIDRSRHAIACAPAAEASGDGASRRFATAGYDGVLALEADAAEHERRRLLYVALTRARDLLVVPVRPKASGLEELLAGHLEGVAVAEVGPAGGRAAQPPRPPASTQVSRTAWRERRERLVAEASAPLAARTPSGLEDLDEEKAVLAERAERGASLRRDRARSVGTAVHATLEAVPLDDARTLPDLARAAAVREGVGDEAEQVSALALACWLSGPVRAAAATIHVRELPVAFAEGEALVEGSIDLAYRGESGWVVVDYKTDAAPTAEDLRRRYGRQAAAYALALSSALGEPVTEAVFVAAADADESGAARAVRVPIDTRALDELRGGL